MVSGPLVQSGPSFLEVWQSEDNAAEFGPGQCLPSLNDFIVWSGLLVSPVFSTHLCSSCSDDRRAEGQTLHKEAHDQRGVRGQTECDPQSPGP